MVMCPFYSMLPVKNAFMYLAIVYPIKLVQNKRAGAVNSRRNFRGTEMS